VDTATVLAAIAAWASVVTAVGGGLYTRSQARSARIALQETREAREAAQDQAHSARESARAASLAADATVDSAHSGRESVAIARAAYDREDRPTFELAADEQRKDPFGVTATLLTGPTEVTIDLKWTASSEGPGEDGLRRMEHLTGTGIRRKVVRGDQFTVPVGVPAWADEATIRLDLSCTDAENEKRTWSCPCVLEWRAPPRPRVRWRL
jgi:hypothetical protein